MKVKSLRIAFGGDGDAKVVKIELLGILWVVLLAVQVGAILAISDFGSTWSSALTIILVLFLVACIVERLILLSLSLNHEFISIRTEKDGDIRISTAGLTYENKNYSDERPTDVFVPFATIESIDNLFNGKGVKIKTNDSKTIRMFVSSSRANEIKEGFLQSKGIH